MAKEKAVYLCSNCGRREPKWTGRCPECGEWNTFREKQPETKVKKNTKSVPLDAIDDESGLRFSGGSDEIDRVLGGGITAGGTVLVGGEPGIGKSTLMLQIAARAGTHGRILYVSGEESARHIRARADRLSAVSRRIEILCESDIEAVVASIQTVRPTLIMIDSIQTMLSEEAGSVPGTVNQIKYGVYRLMETARELSASLFLVAHVTKEGTIAGPKVIEHMVDTVLYFDQSETDLRILRAVKNRFGPVDEIGILMMTKDGLVEVDDPSRLFFTYRSGEMPAGIVPAPVYEGSRILMVEIQALTVPAKGSISRIFSDRIDIGRISRIAAILEKHIGLRFSDQDIYVNVAGGMRINEVGIELPTALALYSARTSVSVPDGLSAAGELTLAGEVRPIRHMRLRRKAALDVSISRLVGPIAGDEESVDWETVESIREAVEAVFGSR